MQIAPWLKAPDVLGAMEGGANVGLRERQLAQERQQFEEGRQDKSQELQLEGQRIQQSAAATAADIGMKQQQLVAAQKENAINAQLAREKNAVEMQYNEVLNSYNQQKSNLAQQKLQQTAETAAKTVADRIGFMQWKADPANAGKDASVGLTQFPGAITQGDLTQETKTPVDATKKVVEDWPAEPEKQVITGQPASSGSWNPLNWDAGAHPSTLATNTIPYKPKTTVTYDVPNTPAQTPAQSAANLSRNPAFQSSPSGGGNLSTGKDFQTPQTKKVADAAIRKRALDESNGDVTSARQWLEDNGYTIPP